MTSQDFVFMVCVGHIVFLSACVLTLLSVLITESKRYERSLTRIAQLERFQGRPPNEIDEPEAASLSSAGT